MSASAANVGLKVICADGWRVTMHVEVRRGPLQGPDCEHQGPTNRMSAAMFSGSPHRTRATMSDRTERQVTSEAADEATGTRTLSERLGESRSVTKTLVVAGRFRWRAVRECPWLINAMEGGGRSGRVGHDMQLLPERIRADTGNRSGTRSPPSSLRSSVRRAQGGRARRTRVPREARSGQAGVVKEWLSHCLCSGQRMNRW
jgi:hypothetical protein